MRRKQAGMERLYDIRAVRILVDEMKDFCEPQCAVEGIVFRSQYDESLPPVRLGSRWPRVRRRLPCYGA